jgi:hypothetical protein
LTKFHNFCSSFEFLEQVPYFLEKQGHTIWKPGDQVFATCSFWEVFWELIHLVVVKLWFKFHNI